jgi:two-component system chemotaxis response regulator CheY
MSLAAQLLHQIADPTRDCNERARLRCQLAKHLEERGDYEGARKAMGELWSRVGERPVLDEIDQATMAEVLLRVGVLTGWIGSVKQIDGSQEMAKNLISESMTIFEALHQPKRVAEAQMELGHCYWRVGSFDEARVWLKEALGSLDDRDGDLKAITLSRIATVEKVTRRLSDALRILTEAAPLFEASSNQTLKGRFHNEYAQVLRKLGEAEHRQDYIDRAFVEYAAASYHFEQAMHTRYHACVENNIGYLFLTIGKYPEAHEHLDRALALFTSLKDSVHTAQVDETRARVLLAEGRAQDAEKLVRSAVQTLDQGGEYSLLAEALTTHGVSLARLGRHQHARLTLQRAVEVAQQAGDLESAGRAALIIVEELGPHLAKQDLTATYERAAELLSASRNLTSHTRLSTCARRIFFLIHVHPTPHDWTNFSFKQAVRRYEASLIEKALRDAGGLVTRASQLLGFKHHNSLISMLNSRHRHLLSERTPIVSRRQSIMNLYDTAHVSGSTPSGEARHITILHVEDNPTVADAVRETLQAAGWKVEICADGVAALKLLESAIYYDVLLLDNELPGINGMELVRLTRKLPHRRRTPVIMLSASDCESEAWRAGVDAFLRKPEDVSAIAETIARLLNPQTKQH